MLHGSSQPGCQPWFHAIISITHKIHHNISFLSSQKHLQTPALPPWTGGWDPHPCRPSSPPAWTTVMESCPGSLPKPWTGSSMCGTLLPGCSTAPNPGITSPPFSSFTDSQLNHAPLTKFSSWPINLSIPSPPNSLSDLLNPYTQSLTLPSSCTHQISIPHTTLQTFCNRLQHFYFFNLYVFSVYTFIPYSLSLCFSFAKCCTQLRSVKIR